MNPKVEEKLKLIIHNEKTITNAASELGVSRQTIYKWLRNYKRMYGSQEFLSQAKKNQTAHNKASLETETTVISLAQKYPDDSVSTLSLRLASEVGVNLNPTTIFRILKRNKIRYASDLELSAKPTSPEMPAKTFSVVEKIAHDIVPISLTTLEATERLPVKSTVQSFLPSKNIPGFNLYRRVVSTLVVSFFAFTAIYAASNLEPQSLSLRESAQLAVVETPTFEALSPKAVLGSVAVVSPEVVRSLKLSPRTFSLSSLTSPLASLTSRNEDVLDFFSTPVKSYTLRTLSPYTAEALTPTTTATASVPFLDRLSLTVFCSLASLTGTVEDTRCNYTMLASGLLAAPEVVTPTQEVPTTATSTPVLAASSAPKTIYITEYITKYVEGLPGVPGKDGADGKDAVAISPLQSQGSFGGYIYPSAPQSIQQVYVPQVVPVSTIGYLNNPTIDYALINFGTSTSQNIVSAKVRDSVFNGHQLFEDLASFTGSVTINNLTATSSVFANATTTNAYMASSTLVDAILTNATTTNASITNLFVTSATSTTSYVSTLIAASSTLTDALLTRATTTDAYIANLIAGSSTLIDAILTNATTTNAFIANLQVSTSTAQTLTVSGTSSLATTTISSLTATNATSTSFFSTLLTAVSGLFTDLIATNATTTNATSTNFFATNASFTNLNNNTSSTTNLFATNATTTNSTSTNFFASNGFITNGSSTNFFTQNLAVGNASTTGNQSIDGSFEVTGTSTLGSNVYLNGSVTIGTSTSNTLTINGLVNSNIVPAQNITYDLGSPSFYWRNLYADNINVNSISAASTTISGTSNDTFSINSDNGSSDAQDSSLVFFRGLVTPNALFRWNATTKRLESNMSFKVQNETPITGTTTLTVQAGAGQGTTNLLEVKNIGGTNLTVIDANGRLGIGSSTPSNPLTVIGNSFLGGNVTATGTISSPDAVITNATSTFFAAVNATTTNATTTRAYITSLVAASSTLQDALTTRSTTTDAYITRLVAASSTLQDAIVTTLNATNATVTSLLATNATTTNFASTNATSTNFFASVLNAVSAVFNSLTSGSITATSSLTSNGTLNVTGQTTLTTASSTGLTATNLYGTNATLTNATSTNFFTSLLNAVTAGFTNLTTTGTTTLATGGGNVGVGTDAPATSLHIAATDGLIIPAGTTAQRPSTLLPGVIRYNTSNTTFEGFNGSTWGSLGGVIDTDQDTYVSAENTPGADNDELKFFTGGSQRAIITAAGNFGIGTTTSGSKLDVNGMLRSTGYDPATSGAGLRAYYLNGVGVLNTYNSDTTTWLPTSLGVSDQMYLLPNGSVGIGTTSPITKLDVNSAGNALSVYDTVTSNIRLAIGTAGAPNYRATLQTYQHNNGSVFGNLTLQENGGNVGIGTTSPSSLLHLQSANPVIQLTDSDTGTSGFIDWQAGTSLKLHAGSDRLDFIAGNVERMRIAGNGNVGIGTTTPGAKLQIDAGSYNANNRVLYVKNSNHAVVNTGYDTAVIQQNDAPTLRLVESGENLSTTLSSDSGISTLASSGILRLMAGGTYNSVGYTGMGGNLGLAVATSGNVGIGTTTPTTALSVAGDGQALFGPNVGWGMNLRIGGSGGTSFPDASVATTNGNLHIDPAVGGFATYLNFYRGTSGVNFGDGALGIVGSVDGAGKLSMRRLTTYDSSFTGTKTYGVGDGYGLIMDSYYTGAGAPYVRNVDIVANTDNALDTAQLRFLTKPLGSSAQLSMLISADGNVGIGTANPSLAKLQIYNGGGQGDFEGLSIQSGYHSNNAKKSLTWRDGSNIVGSIDTRYDGATVDMVFGSLYSGSYNTTDRMTIKGNGNVGIGTTTPTSPFVVYGAGNYGQADIVSSAANGEAGLLFKSADDTDSLGWLIGKNLSLTDDSFSIFRGGNLFTINTNGNVGIGSTTPIAKTTIVSAGNLSSGQSAANAGLFITSDGANGLAFDANQIESINNQPLFVNFGSTGNVALAVGGGAVSVGTTSPAAKLHVSQADTTIGVLFNGATKGVRFGFNSTATIIEGVDSTGVGSYQPLYLNASVLQFGTGGTERVRIDSSGNVGIGTTTPLSKLHVEGTTDTSIQVRGTGAVDQTIQFSRSDQASNWFMGRDNTDSTFRIQYNTTNTGVQTLSNAAYFTIDDNTGNIGIGTTSPTVQLHLASAAANAGGLLIESTSGTSGGVANIELRGRRDDTNGSTPFGGSLYLSRVYTSGNMVAGANDTFSQLGNILFGGNAGGTSTSNIVYPASIGGIVEGTFTSSTTANAGLVFRTGATGLAKDTVNSQFGTERMRITSAGNVGIGTSTPGKSLDVIGQIRTAASAGSGYALIETGQSGTATNNWHFGSEGNGYFNFYNGNFGAGTNRMAISSGGNLGIGTSTPAGKLHVAGSSNSTNPLDLDGEVSFVIHNTNSTNNNYALLRFAQSGSAGGVSNDAAIGSIFTDHDATPSADLAFFTRSNNSLTEKMRVLANGNIGIGTTSPVAKLDIWGNFNVGTSSAPILFANTATGRVGIGTNSPVSTLDILAPNSGIRLMSGSTGAYAGLTFGRVSGDANIAVASGAGVWSDLAAAGDLVIRTETEDLILSARNASGAIRFGTGATDSAKMTITNGGNVGIGTTTPGSKLTVTAGNVEVNGGVAPGVLLRPTSGSSYVVGANTGITGAGIYDNTGGVWRLMVQDTTGNVGIGTTNPYGPLTVRATNAGGYAKGIVLDVNSVTASSSIGIDFNLSTNDVTSAPSARIEAIRGPSAAGDLAFSTRSGTTFSTQERLRITNEGNVGIGTTSPGAKLDVWGNFNVGTSSTPALFVNSTTGRVGVGTNAPSTALTLKQSANSSQLRLLQNNTDTAGYSLFASNTGYLSFSRYSSSVDVTTPALTLDQSGNVGVGTTTPTVALDVVSNSGFTLFGLQGNGAGSGGIAMDMKNTSAGGRLYRFVVGDNNSSDLSGSYAILDNTGGNARRFVITSTGNIGIGTSTPGSRLDVFDSTSSSNIDVFRVITNVGSSNNIKFRIDSDGDLFTDGGTTIGTPADLAENYPALEALDAGTVVAFGSSTVAWEQADDIASSTQTYDISGVQKAVNGYEAVGVISTKAGITLGGNTTNGVPVAFAGRVPVKVTSENGEVKRGDYLTVSRTIPGHAMKLTGEGRAIGRVISDHIAGRDKVMMLIENGYQKLSADGSYASSTAMLTTGNIDLNANGVSIINIKSLVSASGAWSIDEYGKITAKVLCLEDVCINREQLANILNSTGQASGNGGGVPQTDNGTTTDSGTGTSTPSGGTEGENATTTDPGLPEDDNSGEEDTPEGEVVPLEDESAPVTEEQVTVEEPEAPTVSLGEGGESVQ